ncbi:hypothetical protein G7Z17_g81 [Cylindrodendrum hubeiense]|uniref:Uncharacterized protein n=1 Tax=Cylindrodendrum hubeiense TaxID=595255 RepID=A0A9P5HHD4_9HYPO|nr:hypothetical protein G7Z17_g81 [Cylindrodendrum hubeiense]
MVLSVEVTSRVGVSDDDIQFGSCREWLTPISASATIHSDKSKPPVQVGKALGFIIRRSAIQPDFHETMTIRHKGIMNFSLDLFDRYGRLKEEIRQHTLRKGSGVWKEELDNGNLVLIEEVEVEEEYRRKRIGSKLVMHIVVKAMMPPNRVSYAFAAAEAHCSDVGGAHHTKDEGVVSLFRSLRFRRVGLTKWFAWARNKEHPSRHLARDEDPDPMLEIDDMIDSDSDAEEIQCNEDLTQTRMRTSELDACWVDVSPKPKPAITSRNRPLHYAVKTLPDKDALVFLQSHTRGGIWEELPLDALDGRGDTILHVAAKACKPVCVAWLLRQPLVPPPLQADNYAGYTPLEALQAQLEVRRTRISYGPSRTQLVSDYFDGFDEDSVTCLLLLQGVNDPSPEQRMRAKFGCTCNQCLDGFLSPRMLMKLSDQAQMHHGLLTKATLSGDEDWYIEFQDLLEYLPESLRSRVRVDKVLQRAFVSLMGAVAECVSKGKVPRKAAVVEYLQATEEWEQIESCYFKQGGTVAAMLSIVFNQAKTMDPEVGGAIINAEPEAYYRSKPLCRNDLEFGFVRRHCAEDATPPPP